MNIDQILTLFAYNRWATHRILATSVQLSDAQFAAPVGRTMGSLRDKLVHTLDAEIGWRMLCQHGSIAGFNVLTDDDFATSAEIAERWRGEEAEMQAYLRGLTDADLAGLVVYIVPEGRRERVLWHCLYHLVNHGTQHRSEAAAILTEFGASPGELDFTAFLNSPAEGTDD